MSDDATLLRRYAADRAEGAFAELVGRHLPLVYSAAVRRLDGDAHRARDVAQVVFCALARDADRLSKHAVLTGWLYTATRNAVIDAVRSENRRRIREEEAHIMQEISPGMETPPDWSQLRPVLDTAMDQLSDDDREAVLLRFFESRPFAEIGTALGLSEDAARKRVERALDKLRSLLQRHGIRSTSAALATLLASETILAAPASLAASITGAALASGGAAIAAVTLMTVSKLQMGIAAAVVAGGAIGLTTQQKIISTLRESSAGAQQQLARLATENTSLARTRSDADAEIAKLRVELAAFQQPAAAVNRRGDGNRATAANNEPRRILRPLPDTPEMEREKAERHRRYDPFFAQRGLTKAQGDRFVELMIHQAEARQDLQDSVKAAGLRGDAPGVETLRSKLYEPITRELQEMLGKDGYAAYRDYEGTSAYRMGYIEPMLPVFSAANRPLSSQQADQLIQVIMKNTHLTRINPTDIGSARRIDWDSVVAQANDILSPAQLTLLHTYTQRMKSAR